MTRVALLLAVALATPVRAAGPLIVSGSGAPLVWTANPVPFNPDRGPLGALTNAQAVAAVTSNFAVWAAVPTASLSFTNAGALPVDVTSANYTSVVDVCGDGLSPIVFDTDGSITDDLLGAGSSNEVLGFAGPDCGDVASATITEGIAVLNGKWVDGVNTQSNPEIPLADFNAVFIHEFGHYVNLDHSQIGLAEAFDGDPSNDDGIATMFPILVNGAATSSLHLDDEVAVSALYPAPVFGTSRATIAGRILLSDGTTPFQGAYVVARKVDDPRVTAVGAASGARYAPSTAGGPAPSFLAGRFELPGLPPGDYTVEVEQIDPSFTGGSGVGPLDPPATLPGPAEFWNANEASTNPPDDPTEATPITVAAGATTGIDVVINEPVPPTCDSTPASGCVGTTLPGKSSITLRHNATNPARDSLAWRWTSGAVSGTSVYGNPSASTAYTLCVYDEAGGTPVLAAAERVRAAGTCATRACWTARSTGWTYRSRDGAPDGVVSLSLAANTTSGRIALRGKGTALGLPATQLVQSPAVRVQLRSSDGVCFEATYGAPASRRAPGIFSDKSD